MITFEQKLLQYLVQHKDKLHTPKRTDIFPTEMNGFIVKYINWIYWINWFKTEINMNFFSNVYIETKVNLLPYFSIKCRHVWPGPTDGQIDSSSEVNGEQWLVYRVSKYTCHHWWGERQLQETQLVDTNSDPFLRCSQERWWLE